MKSGTPKISDDGKTVKNNSSIVNFFKDTTQNFIKNTNASLPPPGHHEMQALQKAEK